MHPKWIVSMLAALGLAAAGCAHSNAQSSESTAPAANPNGDMGMADGGSTSGASGMDSTGAPTGEGSVNTGGGR